MRNLVFLVWFFCSISVSAQELVPKVLVIGIDGLRADAMTVAQTPNLDGLIANGTYSLDALTLAPTWSGPGWSSICTGVWEDKHGVLNNLFIGANYEEYPHIFNHIESVKPELVTASVAYWTPISNLIVDQADINLQFGEDSEVVAGAVDILENNNPDVLFVDLDDVDAAGHGFGFRPTILEYIQEIENADEWVGQILNAMEARVSFADEDWIVIITSDHGGTIAGHGGSSPEERIIPFIVSGDNVINQEISGKIDTQAPGISMAFSGDGGYARIDNQSIFDFGVDQDFTLECRILVSEWGGDPAVLSNKDWNSGINPGFAISAEFSDGPRWKINMADGANRADINGGETIDGQWHHLSISFDRDGMMTVFQDGIVIDSADISSLGSINTGFPICIGQDGTESYGIPFNGSISEVRIWNAAIEDSTLLEWMCSGIDDTHPDYDSLIGYWPMNGGGTANLIDQSDNGNDATIEGQALWLADGATYICRDYSETPRLVDVAPTALEHLCIPIDPAWNLDGKVVEIICQESVGVEEIVDKAAFSIIPNPAQDKVRIEVSEMWLGAQISIFDYMGRSVGEVIPVNSLSLLIDRGDLPKGIYLIQLSDGKRQYSEQLIWE